MSDVYNFSTLFVHFAFLFFLMQGDANSYCTILAPKSPSFHFWKTEATK